jgi:hypothetical protein
LSNYQFGYQKAAGTPVLICICLGVILGLAGLYFIRTYQIQPFAGYLDIGASAISQVVPTLQNIGQTLYSFFSGNLLALFSLGSVGLGAILTIYTKIQSARVQAKATQQITEAQTTAINASNQLAKVTAEKTDLEKKLEAAAGSDQTEYIGKLESSIEEKNNQMRELQATVNYQNTLIESLKMKTVEKTVVK